PASVLARRAVDRVRGCWLYHEGSAQSPDCERSLRRLRVRVVDGRLDAAVEKQVEHHAGAGREAVLLDDGPGVVLVEDLGVLCLGCPGKSDNLGLSLRNSHAQDPKFGLGPLREPGLVALLHQSTSAGACWAATTAMLSA